MRQRKKEEEESTSEPDETDLVSEIDQTLKLLNKNRNSLKLKEITSFHLIDKIRKNLSNEKKTFHFKKLFKKIFSYWDLFLLFTLNTIFFSYLCYSLMAYYSPKSNVSLGFSLLNEKALKLVSETWMKYNGFSDMSIEECAVLVPDFLNSIVRPIEDCSMCANVKQVDRRESLSKEEFLAKYAYSGVPVIVSDATRNWTAMKEMDFGFLKELYQEAEERDYRRRQKQLDINSINSTSKSPILKTFNSIVESDQQRSEQKITCQFFPYKTKFKSLHEVFEMEVEDERWSKPWYIGWSNCHPYAAEVLRQHYSVPYFLPSESEMSRLDWIFMGTPNYGANMHIDDVNNPSWQAQISGVKFWTFKPPAECLLKCSTVYATVNPGDIIVFDSNRWFHSTQIKGNEISLTIGSEYD